MVAFPSLPFYQSYRPAHACKSTTKPPHGTLYKLAAVCNRACSKHQRNYCHSRSWCFTVNRIVCDVLPRSQSFHFQTKGLLFISSCTSLSFILALAACRPVIARLFNTLYIQTRMHAHCRKRRSSHSLGSHHQHLLLAYILSGCSTASEHAVFRLAAVKAAPFKITSIHPRSRTKLLGLLLHSAPTPRYALPLSKSHKTRKLCGRA